MKRNKIMFPNDFFYTWTHDNCCSIESCNFNLEVQYSPNYVINSRKPEAIKSRLMMQCDSIKKVT